jgi:hypothetical protein
MKINKLFIAEPDSGKQPSSEGATIEGNFRESVAECDDEWANWAADIRNGCWTAANKNSSDSASRDRSLRLTAALICLCAQRESEVVGVPASFAKLRPKDETVRKPREPQSLETSGCNSTCCDVRIPESPSGRAINSMKDIFADHGWLFLWLGFLATLYFAWHDHHELYTKVKSSSGRQKFRASSKLAMLWLLPVVLFIGTLSTQLGSDKADGRIAALSTNLSGTTSNLLTATALLKDATNRLADIESKTRPKPIDEKLRIWLDELDPTILIRLRNGTGHIAIRILRDSRADELERLCAEPGADQYVRILPPDSPLAPAQAGEELASSGGNGTFRRVAINLNSKLVPGE